MRRNKIQKFKQKLMYLYFGLILILKSVDNISTEGAFYFLVMFMVIYILYKNYRINYFKKLTFKEIDKLKGEEFEEYLEFIYKKLGYNVKLTYLTADYGADLILRKGKNKTVLQAKRWSSKVGVKAIQEVVASKSYYKANTTMVVTNNYFTKNAVNLAKANDVILIDRIKLKEIIKEIS